MTVILVNFNNNIDYIYLIKKGIIIEKRKINKTKIQPNF